MQLAQTVSMAFKAISGNKVRAFLTMLGVIIGVMSVFVLIAIGQGTTASVTESIASMGTNLLTVSIQTRSVGMPVSFVGFGVGSSSGKGTVILTLDDILVHDPTADNLGLQTMLAEMKGPDFPVALGVIRDVDDITYDEEVNKQVESVKASAKIHSVDELLHSGSTWEV